LLNGLAMKPKLSKRELSRSGGGLTHSRRREVRR
jgi:hypothetical protein